MRAIVFFIPRNIAILEADKPVLAVMKKSIPLIGMPDRKERRVLFEVQSMRYIDENRHERIHQAHKHDYFVIIWVQKGRGKHMVDFHEFQIADSSIYFLTPGQIHHLASEGMPDGYVISFYEEFLATVDGQREFLTHSGLFFNCSNFKVFSVSNEQSLSLLPLIDLMVQEQQKHEELYLESLRSLLTLFIINASRFWGHKSEIPTSLSKPALLNSRFLNLLEKNFKSITKVADYASMLVVTPNHLNDVVKSVTGFPASEHIKRRVVLEAKRLAYSEDYSAKQIAYELGFDDEAHFSKYFKKNSGLNFSEFRKSRHSIG